MYYLHSLIKVLLHAVHKNQLGPGNEAIIIPKVYHLAVISDLGTPPMTLREKNHLPVWEKLKNMTHLLFVDYTEWSHLIWCNSEELFWNLRTSCTCYISIYTPKYRCTYTTRILYMLKTLHHTHLSNVNNVIVGNEHLESFFDTGVRLKSIWQKYIIINKVGREDMQLDQMRVDLGGQRT